MMMNRIGIRPSTANFKSWALLQIQIEVTSSVWKGKNLFVLFPPPHLIYSYTPVIIEMAACPKIVKS